jgi:hypothetical protein
MEKVCKGEHNFYCPDVVGVESEGTVHILLVCIHCGDAMCKTFRVAATPGAIRLLREEKGE